MSEIVNETTAAVETKKPRLDPNDLITFQFKSKTTGAITETKMLKGTSAMNWFYLEHPLGEGRIITELIQVDPPVFRAEIWINDTKVATGHANTDGNSNTLKRIETVAIRRALANAGYAADQIIKRISDSIGVEAAKQMLGSGKAKQERRLGDPTPNDTRNPIARLTAGLEENGITLELAATALKVKDLNDIEEWRSFGKTPKEIAEKAKSKKTASPFGKAQRANGAPKPDDADFMDQSSPQQLFDDLPGTSEAAQRQFEMS